MPSPYILPTERTDNYVHVPLSLRAYCEHVAGDWAASDVIRATHQFEPFATDLIKGTRRRFDNKKAPLVIPQDVRDEADKYSRELVFSFSSMRSRVLRDKSHGSLDSSKLARLAAPGLSSRAFDRLASTAFKHREHVKAKSQRPRIAIVADMNNDIRRANPGYMAMLGRLAYVLAEAATLSGVEVALIGSRGSLYGSQNTKLRDRLGLPTFGAPPVHIPMILKDWDGQVSAREFYVFTSQMPFVATVRAATAMLNRDGAGMESNSGRGGIEYARAQGANYVIGFGKFGMNEKPDLLFQPSASMPEIVAAVCGFMERAA